MIDAKLATQPLFDSAVEKRISPLISSQAAWFSRCGTYRYGLRRAWKPNGRRCLFIMLNPSTADENVDDPTIRKCIKFARMYAHGVLTVVNLFAVRATDPKVMRKHIEPVGVENDWQITHHARLADTVFCAWGNHGKHKGRDAQVKSILWDLGKEPVCLGLNQNGTPKHPLYQPYNVDVLPFDVAAEQGGRRDK